VPATAILQPEGEGKRRNHPKADYRGLTPSLDGRPKRDNGPREGTSDVSAKDVGLSPKTPIGRHKVKIVGFEMPDAYGSPESRMNFVSGLRMANTQARSSRTSSKSYPMTKRRR
jgi:hypothetical protein